VAALEAPEGYPLIFGPLPGNRVARTFLAKTLEPKEKFQAVKLPGLSGVGYLNRIFIRAVVLG
jgi:hypothetical protein